MQVPSATGIFVVEIRICFSSDMKHVMEEESFGYRTFLWKLKKTRWENQDPHINFVFIKDSTYVI